MTTCPYCRTENQPGAVRCSHCTSWMDQRLALVDAVPPANGALRANAASAPSGDAALLTARVSAFQLSHGLQPDGLAGPMTLMQLNRASGISEPRLRTEP